MLHYVKSHIYKSYIFFTASINLFYSSFLQSIDRWQFLFFKKYVYIRSSSLSFKHITCLKFLTSRKTYSIYEMSNVLKMYGISRCGQPNEGRQLGEGVVIHPLSDWHVHSVSPAKYALSSFALIFFSLLFSHESFLIFRGLGHSLILLLRLRSFPPTTYNVTHLGKTEFLVPFSCLHQTALSNCPDKTVVEKVFKGNKWSGQVRILSEHYWEVKSLLQLP